MPLHTEILGNQHFLQIICAFYMHIFSYQFKGL